MRLRVAKKIFLGQCSAGDASGGPGCHRRSTVVAAERRVQRAYYRNARGSWADHRLSAPGSRLLNTLLHALVRREARRCAYYRRIREASAWVIEHHGPTLRRLAD